MSCNLGKTDRIIRTIIGLSLFSLGLIAQSYLGLIGLIPLLTALLGFCPFYPIFRLNTRCQAQ